MNGGADLVVKFKKHLKRILAFGLAVVTVFSSTGTEVYAASTYVGNPIIIDGDDWEKWEVDPADVVNQGSISEYVSDTYGVAYKLDNSVNDISSEISDADLVTEDDILGSNEADISEPEYIYGLDSHLSELVVSDELNAEKLEEELQYSTMEQIGEWLYSLEEDELEYVLSLDTILNEETIIVYPDEHEINEGNDRLLYYEACEFVYFQSQASLFAWTDRFFGGRTGNAKFSIGIKCDGDVAAKYTITCNGVTQPSDGSAISLGLSFITGSGGTCNKGHNVDITFKSMYAVTDSDDWWSGIRIFGSYVRPAGYKAVDYSYNDVAPGTHGFGALGYTRFGTSTYGEMSYDNPYVIDAAFYDHDITDEFCFEGNASQIGLFDGLSGYNINNYGRSHYYIDLSPSGKTYIIDPNGGYLDGSNSVVSYRKYSYGEDTTVINAPVWNSTTEGMSFKGWKVSGDAYLKDAYGNTSKTGTVINTDQSIKLYHKTSGNGVYRNEIDCSDNYYTPYINFGECSDARLTAIWNLDWIQVYFDGNKPSEETTYNIEGLSPTEKRVNYSQAYGTLPEPSLYGYKFMGWYTAPTGGVQVTASTICNATTSHTLYARWQDIRYTLTFDVNKPAELASTAVGGMNAYAGGKQVFSGYAYGYLPGSGNNNWPTPTLGSMTFLGWYTAPVGGAKVNASTIVTMYGDHKVYAHWDGALTISAETKMGLSTYSSGGQNYDRGGAFVNWQDYYKSGSTYNVYRKLASAGSYTQISPGPPSNSGSCTTQKYWDDGGANDTASPNAINTSTLSLTKTGSNTNVKFTAPKDNGTAYDFYVNEVKFLTSADVSGRFGYANYTQSYMAPVRGVYSFALYGGASNSGQQGGVVTGTRTIGAGGSVYIVTGGKGSGTSGGYNGGGSGGSGNNGNWGSGGGGATHLATTNRGVLANYASYTGELLAVAAGAGGTGGSSVGGWNAGSGGPGGNAGAAGTTREIYHSTYRFTIIAGGGGAGTLSGPGSGGAQRSWINQRTPTSHNVYTGAGGGGGAGYYGGGGGTAGSLMYSNLEIEGWGGSAGSFGAGGNGANAVQHNGAYYGCAGGGGGGGANYNALGSANSWVGSTGNGFVDYSIVTDLDGRIDKTSNTVRTTVTTGIKGYRYTINQSSNTNITDNSVSFSSSASINVPNQGYGQYLHIAAQDVAGNLSGTVHIYIEPTYTITYNLDGGRLPDGVKNPDGFTATTPTFTLNNPIQDGMEFIGWTGSNGSTPQMTVTIPTGSTGNRTYTANWAQSVPYVTDLTVEGNIYKFKDKEYFIKCGTVFDMKFSSYVKNRAGSIISSPVFTPTNNFINVKDKDGNYVQTRDNWMAMNEFKGYFGKWSYSVNQILKINDYVLNTRTTTPFGSVDGYTYLNTATKGRLDEHLQVVYLYPQAGVNYNSNMYKSAQFDDAKKVKVTADGKAPLIIDDIQDDAVYDKKIVPIHVTVRDEDTGESGVKNLKVTLTNLDTGYSEVICDITNNTYSDRINYTAVNSQGGAGLILKDNDNYVGKLKFTIETSDNVNNKAMVEKTIYVISLDTNIKRMLPTFDRDGNLIPDNVFRDGEQGELIIGTTGFVDQIDIIFDDYLQNKAIDQGYEFQNDVLIPIPNEGDTKNLNIRTTPLTVPDTTKPYRTDEYFFFIPLGTHNPNPSDPSDNIHYVIIKAHKEDKVITNLILLGGAGPNGEDIIVPDIDIDIEGNFEADLRTRIREMFN